MEVRSENRKDPFAGVEQVLDEWGLGGSQCELVSQSENVVFRVNTDSGELLALRLHRPGYHTLAELNAEQQWTAALNRAGLSAPVHRLTVNGRGLAKVYLPEISETRYVSLSEWTEGELLATMIGQDPKSHGIIFPSNSEVAPSDAQVLLKYFFQIGRIAARIHNQAMTWQMPDSFERHAFDIDGLMGDAPLWGPFWNLPQLTAAEREQILRVRDRIRRILSEYGKNQGTYGLIHADLHPGNLLFLDDRIHVIDFDDAGFGWHQYELAVALFHYAEDPLFDAIRDALVAGYRTERSLDDAAVELLPVFILIRYLVLLGWIQERPELNNSHRLPRLTAEVCERAKTLLS